MFLTWLIGLIAIQVMNVVNQLQFLTTKRSLFLKILLLFETETSTRGDRYNIKHIILHTIK